MTIPTFSVIPQTVNPDTFALDMDTWLSEIVAWTAAVNAASSTFASAFTTASTTSLAIGTGEKTFTVPASLSYVAGQSLIAAYDADNRMYGAVVSYSGTTLVIDVATVDGSGTHASWAISLSIPLIGIMGSANGGTGNGFTKFSGPTTAEKTFTLPNSNANFYHTVTGTADTIDPTGLPEGTIYLQYEV